jgi:hypothetical protein
VELAETLGVDEGLQEGKNPRRRFLSLSWQKYTDEKRD